MELLQRTEDRGYPEEYLVARIRGRSVRFVRDWDGLVFSPDPAGYLRTTEHGELIEAHAGEGAWLFLEREFRWLYTQMNGRLKDIFDPLFMCFEIETLIRCFRYKYSKEDAAELEDILRYSLLSHRIKEIVKMKTDLLKVLEELEKRELLPSGGMGRPQELYGGHGLQGLEQGLSSAFLETVTGSGLHPLLRDFFKYTIDMRNINALYQCLRWGIAGAPYLIEGGSVGLERLRKLFYEKGMQEFERIVFSISGVGVKESTPAGIDNALQKGLTRRLRTAGRRGSNIGLILGYLWKCYMEAHDISTVMYGSGMNRDLLREELIN